MYNYIDLNCLIMIHRAWLSLAFIQYFSTFADTKEGLTKEYCSTETFEPICGNDEVIMMQSAKFGRMRLGECLDGDYGHLMLGCTADILSKMDEKCSVLSLTGAACDITLKSGRHSFASSSLADKDCGTDRAPLVIRSKPGQKINISLTDFNWNAVHTNIQGCVHRYGYFIDDDTVVNICGKTKRKKHVMLSHRSTIQLAINKASLQNIGFLLTIEVIGCPNFKSPKDTWTKEDNDVVTVGCVHSDKTWRMRCIRNHWIGIQGKCEKVKQRDRELKIEIESGGEVLGMSSVVGFTLIGGVFLVVISILLTVIIGYFCIRKQKLEEKGCYLAPVSQMYDSTTIPIAGYHTMIRNIDDNVTSSAGQTQVLISNSSLNPRIFNNDLLQNSASSDRQQKELVYDAVYQNIGDC